MPGPDAFDADGAEDPADERVQARRAEGVRDFLVGLFCASDPRLAGNRQGDPTPNRELLDRSVARMHQRFADRPERRIELLRTATDLYGALNDPAAIQPRQSRLLVVAEAEHDAALPCAVTGRQAGRPG